MYNDLWLLTDVNGVVLVVLNNNKNDKTNTKESENGINPKPQDSINQRSITKVSSFISNKTIIILNSDRNFEWKLKFNLNFLQTRRRNVIYFLKIENLINFIIRQTMISFLIKIYLLLFSLISFVAASKLASIKDSIDFPICKIQNNNNVKDDQCTENTCNNNELVVPKIIIIGDIHGEYQGFLDVLSQAKITKSSTDCNWILPEDENQETIFLQVGDLVDRGPGATESWNCLKHLQDTTPVNTKVIRLLGSKFTKES